MIVEREYINNELVRTLYPLPDSRAIALLDELKACGNVLIDEDRIGYVGVNEQNEKYGYKERVIAVFYLYHPESIVFEYDGEISFMAVKYLMDSKSIRYKATLLHSDNDETPLPDDECVPVYKGIKIDEAGVVVQTDFYARFKSIYEIDNFAMSLELPSPIDDESLFSDDNLVGISVKNGKPFRLKYYKYELLEK